MAVWGIDIGHTALKAVKINRTKEGLEIDQVAYIPIEGGEAEEDRPEKVRVAVKTFLERHPIRNERVVVSLPGLHAFSRFIKLPPVDSKKVDEMVVYEAQQQIPFPIDEVMWGYHKIERDYEPGEEYEVGIFAARKELLLGFLSELKDNGVSPDQVTIAPLAIYNFVTYNADIDEETVILDIGAKHTDLIVVKGGRFFIRNLRIAGSDITEALSSRFKIPTHEAEKLKRQGSASKNADKIFSAMKNVLKDFAGEVHRSISFFKAQAGELNPKKVLLVGDGAKLKNIKPFFEKELKMKVEKFTKLEQDKFVVGEAVDFDVLRKHILSFGVSLGLGVQGVGMAKTQLNLLPTEDQIVGELKRKVPFAAATAAVCWIAVGLGYVYWSGKNAELAKTLKSSAATAGLKNEHEQALQAMDYAAIEEKSMRYRGLLGDRMLPLKVMNELRQLLPQNNAEIYQIPKDQRATMPPSQQRDQINNNRPELVKQKFWVLDMKIEEVAVEKEAAPGQDPNAPKERPQTGLLVELLVARHWPQGVERTAVFDEVRKSVSEKIRARFADGPYWVRSPGQARKEGKADVQLGAAIDLSALDRDVRSAEGLTSDEFRCLAFPIRFEVGFKPIVEAPAEGTGEGN